jgi:transcriptional regulator with XRE-family HTH domain
MDTPLKRLREDRGISAEAVAVAVGVSQAAVSRVENGKAQASPRLADRLARYFGNAITRDQILYPEDYVGVPIRKGARSTSELQAAS